MARIRAVSPRGEIRDILSVPIREHTRHFHIEVFRIKRSNVSKSVMFQALARSIVFPSPFIFMLLPCELGAHAVTESGHSSERQNEIKEKGERSVRTERLTYGET